MAFNAIDNTRVNAAKFPDDWYADEVVAGKEQPYASLTIAYQKIPSAVRMSGRPFLVKEGGETVEYWWKDDLTTAIPKGGVSFNDVPLKTTISGIRALSGNLKTNLFTTTDAGQEGQWKLVSGTYTSTDDNTGDFLVDVDGRGYQRISDHYENDGGNYGLSTVIANNSPFATKLFNSSTAKKRRVILPPGEYTFSDTVTFNNVEVIGTNTILSNTKATGILFEIGSNVILKGISFDGRYDAALLTQRVCVNMVNASNITIDDCRIYNCNKVAMIGVNLNNFNIRNCDFYNNGGNLQLFDGGINITIDNNKFRDSKPIVGSSGTNGISFNRNNNTQVYKNTKITNNYLANLTRMGIECFNLLDSEISYNYIENMTDMGMSFPLLKSCNIEFNTIKDVGSYAIEVPGTNGRNKIQFNNISNPKGGTNEAIILSTFSTTALQGSVDSKYDVVRGNRFENWQNAANSKVSIKIRGGDNSATILNNSYSEVTDNIFINCGTAVLFESSSSVGHKIERNQFILNASTLGVPRFLNIVGQGVIVKNNIVRVTNGAFTVQGQCIGMSLCTDVIISGNTFELGNMYEYAVRETSACQASTIVDNTFLGFTIAPVLHKVATSTVKKYSGNGVSNDTANVNLQADGTQVVTDFNGGQILTGLTDPEGVVTAKLGSLLVRSKSRSGATDSIGALYQKIYQAGSVDTNAGWGLVAATIIDNVLTSTTSTFGNINTKYPVAKQPIGTHILFPLFNNGTGALFVRKTDTTWLNIAGDAKGSTKVVTSATTLVLADYGTNGELTVFLDASGASFILTLPTAATTAGLTTYVVKTDASANTPTIKGNGSELINNANTDTTLSTQNASFILKSNGTKHFKF